jgi:hypothetical protein
MVSSKFSLADKQSFKYRILNDPTFHQQVLRQLQELHPKSKKARQLRKHYESIPMHERVSADPRDEATRLRNQIQDIHRRTETQAGRSPSRTDAPRGSGQARESQASRAAAAAPIRTTPTTEASQAQRGPLRRDPPVPLPSIQAERPTQAGGSQVPEASAAQSPDPATARATRSQNVDLIKLIAANKASNEQSQLFKRKIVYESPSFPNLVDQIEKIYKASSSISELMQLKFNRAMIFIDYARLVVLEPGSGSRDFPTFLVANFATESRNLPNN